MNKKLLFPILTLLLFTSGCSIYSVVSTDKDNKVDFTKYKTYAWLPDKDNAEKSLNNEIIRNNIKNYFTHEFVDKYRLTADTETPDVLMELEVTVINKVQTDKHAVTRRVPFHTYGYPYPYNTYSNNYYSNHRYYSPQPNPYNYNGYTSGYRYATNYIKRRHPYKESNITINMIDSEENELVWTVTAQPDIYENESINIQDDIHPAVLKMMEYFPLKQIALKEQ